jgi:hypothetical protein
MRIGWILLLCFAAKQSFAQNISGVVNQYRKVLWADSASGRLKLSDVTGLSGFVGNKALIIQMKGATMNQGSSITDANFGNITNINSTGYYEVGSICGFLSDTMIMERKLNNFYETAGLVQVVIMPKYTNVTVVDTVKAADWDPATGTGGVVAIEATGTIFLNKPISATGAGFRGGDYVQYGSTCNVNPLVAPTDYYMPFLANAVKTGGKKGEGIADFVTGREYARGKQVNGGGGGNNHNSGGGGGGNHGAGGNGGNRVNSSFGVCQSNSPGVGGLSLASQGYALTPTTRNRIFMGGGGGAGHDNDGTGLPGGNGGGIVFILANTVDGNSTTSSDNLIMANGAAPSRFIPAYGIASSAAGSDGAGGGGAGGTVVINVNSFGGFAISIRSNGGAGGGTETFGQNQCCGPGGGGGGGFVWLSTITSSGGLSITIAGGANGTTSATASCANSANGATVGSTGSFAANFALAVPKDSSPVCKQVLYTHLAAGISGYQQNGQRLITATVNQPDNVKSCHLEKAATDGAFATIASLSSNGQPQYRFTDNHNSNTMALYRIKLISKDGAVTYSPTLRMGNGPGNTPNGLWVYPNPSRQKVTVQVLAQTAGNATLTVTNAQGSRLWQQRQWLQKGHNVLPLTVEHWPEGVLFLEVRTAGGKTVRQFVKLGK